MSSESTPAVRLQASDLKKFCVAAMLQAGVSPADAELTAEVLVTTDTWGTFTHGTRQLRGLLKNVRNGRLDVLATNSLGAALYSQVVDDPVQPPNVARFLFLNARGPEFFVDWESVANDAVGILRAEAGRDPYDKGLTDLVGELSTRSEEFRVRWAAHDVKFHRTGTKRLRHPIVGDLTLAYEALDLPGDTGQRILAYTAEPGSPSHEALELLASWSATLPAAAHDTPVDG